MKRFFKRFVKIPRKHHSFLVGASGMVAFLVLVALLMSNAGAPKLGNLLAVNHILPDSQGACVFHCNDTAYTLEGLNPTVGGALVSTVAPSTPVQWIWNAGSYGANTFSPVCFGSTGGSGLMCTVQQDTPNTNFATCSPSTQYCTGYTDQGIQCVETGPSGDCLEYQDVQTCNGYAWTTATGCGNADDQYGHACYGASGGITVTGGAPPCEAWPASGGGGYDGNYPASTLTLTAPSTPGTYNYYFCSNWLLHDGGNALSCLASPLTVSAPAPTCAITPTSQGVAQGGSASISYSTTNATGITYTVDGGSAITPSGNPYTVSGLAVGSHNIIMTATGAGGSGTCGTNADVTVGGTPSMTDSLTSTAGNASAGGSITVAAGTTLNITATYAAGSGDTIAQTVLNVAPPSPSAEYNANYTTPYNQTTRSYSFAPVTPGVYVIKPYISTLYYTNQGWLNIPGDNITVTVTAAGANAFISAASNSINYGASTTLTWSSTSITPGSCTLTASPASTGGGSNAPTTFTSAGTMGAGVPLGIDPPIVIGSNIYRFGGYTGSAFSNAIASAPLSNPTSWSSVGSMASPSEFGAPTAVIGNYIYLFGGYNGTGASNVIQRAPISSPTSFTVVGTLPAASYDGTLVIVGDYVYIFGSYNGTTWTNTIMRAPLADPAGSWASDGAIATNYDGVGSPLVYNGNIYLIGGIYSGSYSSSISVASVSSPTTFTLSGSSLPTSLGNMGGLLVAGNEVYMYGGSLNGSTYTNTVYASPLASFPGGWVTTTTVPAGLPIFTTPLIIGGTAYFFGGVCAAGTQAWCSNIYTVPVNTLLPATDYSDIPNETDNGDNIASTWALSTTTNYTFTCNNPSGGTKSQTATVVVDACSNNVQFPGVQTAVPANCTQNSTTGVCSANSGYTISGGQCVTLTSNLSITANGSAGPITIPANTQPIIAWSSSNILANSCYVTYPLHGTVLQKADNNATGISPPLANGTTIAYSLECRLSDNSASTTPSVVTVTTSAPIIPGVITGQLLASPTRVKKGNQTTLTWSTTNMTGGCSLTYIDGTHSTSTQISTLTSSAGLPQTINSNTTDTLTCTDGNGEQYSSSVNIGIVPVTEEI